MMSSLRNDNTSFRKLASFFGFLIIKTAFGIYLHNNGTSTTAAAATAAVAGICINP